MKKISALLLLGLMLFFALTASASAIEPNTWFPIEITDEFGEPTGKHSCAYTFENASFSNSATSDSDLSGVVRIEKSNGDLTIAMKFFEYNNHIVSNYSSRDVQWYTVLMMDADKNKYTIPAGIVPNGNWIVLVDGDSFSCEDLLALFKKGGTVKFIVTEDERTLNKYKFSVNCSNFNAIYENYLETL